MKKTVAIYPGSFDPLTNGHLDIIKRSVNLCDKLIIAVLNNSKKTDFLSESVRVNIINNVLKSENLHENIEVDSFNGLLVDFAKKNDAKIIIRGLRAVTDFDYEFSLAVINSILDKGIETIFLMSNEKYTYLSSSLIKEAAKYGGDISELVPKIVNDELKKKFNNI